MRVDAATREITCKIVYYGPGMSGKTTNLQQLHDRAPSRAVGDLVTLDTHSERTLHFDLLPMDVGQIDGHAVRFEFYTVPGQSYYASTRRLVLEGADAIVFVADSRREALDENIDSMNDLFDNWRHLGLAEDLPVVLQYNKQDLASALKPEQLDPLLNSRRWPSHTAVAVIGTGVVESMKTVASLVLERVRSRISGQPISALASPQNEEPEQRTWLITCHRCQNMLEITGAQKGDLFTCGACGTPLEIADLERGLTRHPPQPAPPPIPAPKPMRPQRDDSGYGLQALPDPSGAALGHGSGGHAPGTADLGAGFELPGFESLALIEETVQGRRFRVRDNATGQRYRATILSAALMRQPGYAGQVEPYVRMAAKIRHANILALHSLHPGRETPVVLSQDAPDHESLSHVLARRRTLAPPHAVQIARQIALACEEASRQGVVHGWLRPDVVLINADSHVLVDEFGVPKHYHYLTRELSGASAATEYYLAPEHMKEEVRSDIRSDMFMLGALLFRMLTGEGLVTGYTCHEALHKVSAQGCRTARSAQPNLSRDLDNFISRLTAIDRSERFETWQQVLALCERFGGGARQQTFRLTQTHAASGGTGTVRRTQTGSHARTGSVTRPQTGGYARTTASHHRAPSGDKFPATSRTAAHQRRPGGGGGMIVLLVILLLAAAGTIVAMMANPRKPTPINDPTPLPTPVQQPAQPTTPTTPTKPPTTTTPDPTPAPVTTTPNTGPRGGEQGPNTRLPGFMGGGPATGGGAAPTDPPAVTPDPVVTTDPAVEPPPTTISDDEFARIRLQITDALREERFRLALDLCEKLPVETRQALSADIFARHQARRAEVSAQAKKDPASARVLLEGILKVWNMPGDAEWAQTTLGGLPATGTGTGAAPGGPTSSTGTGAPDAGRVAWQVGQQLIANQPTLAEQGIRTLPADSAEAKALTRRVTLWNDRVAILKPAIAEKRRLLRITNPQDGQGWDVVGIEDGGLQITSSTGSTTSMGWSLVPIKEFSRIAMEVSAARKQPDARESALAVVLLTCANDIALAQVHLNRSRDSLAADLASDLDVSIALHKSYATKALIGKADEAMAAGDAKTAADLVEALRRHRSEAGIADQLTRLEAALTALQSGKPTTAANGAPLRDRLLFDDETDLGSLPLRDGTWNVADSMLKPEGGRGSVTRKDLQSAKSVTILFQAFANRGALNFQVRDVRILLDLQAQKLSASTRDTELKPVDVQVIPRIIQTLYVEFRQDGNVLVELNNGVVSLDLKQQKAGDALVIAYDTDAAFAIDEISLVREVKLDPAAEAQRIAAVRATGFEPLGRATLIPPMIHLPNSTPNSGIAFARRDGIASITFEAKGTGKLEIRFGKMNEGGGQVLTLDLGPNPDTPVTYTVSCSGTTITVRSGGPEGEPIAEDRMQGDPPHMMIIARQEAIITSTPRLNRQ